MQNKHKYIDLKRLNIYTSKCLLEVKSKVCLRGSVFEEFFLSLLIMNDLSDIQRLESAANRSDGRKNMRQ